MDVLVIISQALLYICLAILTGSVLLLLTPASSRPAIAIPHQILIVSALMIPVLAFVPVLKIILYIAPRFGFFDAFILVITTYTVGTAWDLTLFLGIILALFIHQAHKQQAFTQKVFLVPALLLICLTIGSIAWASHAAAVDPLIGMVSDFLHLAAVASWVGILVVIGLFATNYDNWLAFLKWFTIVAISCLSLTAISGLFLMDTLVDGYVDGWMTSYGQGLLLKHLFLLPLLFYAVVNSFFVKYKVSKDPSYSPLVGVRIEGFILMTVFILTAVFTQQPPPHGQTLSEEIVSPLFRLFHSEPIQASSSLGFAFQPMSVLLFFITLLLFIGMVIAFFKKAPLLLSLLCSVLYVGSLYVFFMLTVIIR